MNGSELERSLRDELDELERRGRRRRLPRAVDAAPDCVDFLSNDVLGLANATLPSGQVPVGTGAARLLGGTHEVIDALEREVAEWMGAEAALLFPSGYQANVGLLPALAGRGDALLMDEEIHASLVDGARLARARRVIVPHLDLVALEYRLRETRGARRRIVVTESVFSMCGSGPDLARLDELCAEHDAWWVVDEAHAIGLLGPDGAGAAAGLELPRLAARIVTGGKALGAAGALVVGGSVMIELVAQRARSFMFTTGTSPLLAAALRRAVAAVRSLAEQRARPTRLAARLAQRLGTAAPRGAIVFHVIGDEHATIEAAVRLREQGFAVGAVRPPTVPEGRSGLRIVCHADHDVADIDRLAVAVAELPDTCAPRAQASSRVAIGPDSRAGDSEVPPPLVVVGTDTGVGKTVVSALVMMALSGPRSARYWKPIQTGDECDTSEVARLAGADCAEPRYRFALPASPHEAAAAEGSPVELAELDDACTRHRRALHTDRPGARLVVELAGGLLVPLDCERTQADWIVRHARDVILVARSGLGTLNHTLLTSEALHQRGLRVRALVLVGPDHVSNRRTLTEKGVADVVITLPPLTPLDAESLAACPAVDSLREALT